MTAFTITPAFAITLSLIFFYFSVILTNYILNSSKYLENLVCVLGISLPWDGSKTSFSLEKTVNWFLYNRFIVNKMKEMVLQ